MVIGFFLLLASAPFPCASRLIVQLMQFSVAYLIPNLYSHYFLLLSENWGIPNEGAYPLLLEVSVKEI